MLVRSIATDKRLNKLKVDDQWLYMRILPFLDDYGKTTGNIFELKYLVIPSCNWSEERIRNSLERIMSKGLIGFEENKVTKFFGFSKNQKIGHRKQNSRFPDLQGDYKKVDIAPTKQEKPPKSQGLTPEYLELWNTYPTGRRFQKEKCHETWKKKIKEVKPKIMLKALENQIKYLWAETEPGFVPHFSTWLNQNRWEQDVSNPLKKKTPKNKVEIICPSCQTISETNEITHSMKCSKCNEYGVLSMKDYRLEYHKHQMN